MAEKPGEPPQVLRGSCKQHFVSDAAQAQQPKPVEPESSLHTRKSHLDLLALPARLLESFRIGQATVCTENLIRVDSVMESPKLAE